jgi:hypothetical protein
LHDDANQPVTGAIVEVQRHVDPDKLLTWPVYATTLRAKFECSAVLFVLALQADVAAWARRPIR